MANLKTLCVAGRSATSDVNECSLRQDINPLLSCLAKNTTLTILDVSKNRIDDEGFQIIAASLVKDANRCSDDDVFDVFEYLLFDVFWCIWCVLMCFDVFCCVLMYFDVFWCVLMCLMTVFDVFDVFDGIVYNVWYVWSDVWCVWCVP